MLWKFLFLMDFKARNPENKGIIKVQIKSEHKNLYYYLLQYEKYKTDFGKMPATRQEKGSVFVELTVPARGVPYITVETE